MKKNIVIIVLLVIIIVLAGVLFVNFKSVDENVEPQLSEEQTGENIKVFLPESYAVISSPLTVSGQARGTWFFEADAGLQIIAEDGTLLGQSYITTAEDWMQEGFVDFDGQIEFNSQDHEQGFVVFNKANPSDLPQNDQEFRVPVFFEKAPQSLTVQVYFSNTQKDLQMLDCSKVYAVERQIPYTKAVARAALTELLAGPTAQEQNQGYQTSINEGVAINSIVIEDRTAKVDFDEQLQYQVGGSCRIAAIYAQIKQTLLQFSTVDEVLISINGKTKDILQP